MEIKILNTASVINFQKEKPVSFNKEINGKVADRCGSREPHCIICSHSNNRTISKDLVNLAAINSISFSIEMPWWREEGFQTEWAECLESTEVTEQLTSQDDDLCGAGSSG